jgi:hypothetical protein
VLPLSILSLILVNLIPLLGVFFLDWNLSAILALYWSENVVIGFFNVLKMALAQGSVAGSGMTLNRKPVKAGHKPGLILFFIVHFGMFTFGHGVFVFSIFAKDLPALRVLLPAFLLLFVSHGVSFGYNFIGKGEFRRTSFTTLFTQPYKRIFIMHLTVILGAGAAGVLQEPVMALVVLIALKTVTDVVAHAREHKKFSS